MSTPHPHSVADLSLAPVLIELERGLDVLRRSRDLEFDLALSLNDDARAYPTAAQRADRIRQFAVRDVDLHGWNVEPTSDGYGLAVRHGEFSVSLMFGKRLTGYVEQPQASGC
jgi:hypothetical protein